MSHILAEHDTTANTATTTTPAASSWRSAIAVHADTTTTPASASSRSDTVVGNDNAVPHGHAPLRPGSSTDVEAEPTGIDAITPPPPSPSPATLSRTERYLHALRTFAIDQWFLLALSILIIISSQVQVPLDQQSLKETIVTYAAVAVIFFITGCTLPTSVLIANYTRIKLHLFVQIQCFLMTSATTFAIVSIAATDHHFMDPWLLIGMLMTGCVPTTISSNVVMTRQAGGNSALTVVQSTIGNFLGPFLTPVLLRMYTGTGAWYTLVLPATSGGYGQVYQRVFKQLGLSLFLPLFVGQVVQNLFPTATRKVMADWRCSKLGSFGLLSMIWQTFDAAFATGAFESVPGRDMVFLVFMSVAFYVIWLGVAFGTSLLWLPRKDVISVCYCVPAKVSGLPTFRLSFLPRCSTNV